MNNEVAQIWNDLLFSVDPSTTPPPAVEDSPPPMKQKTTCWVQ